MKNNICLNCKFLKYDVFFCFGDNEEYWTPYCEKTDEEFPNYENCEYFQEDEKSNEEG